MTEKEKIKYLDIVFNNIENTEMFTIDSILSEKTNLSNDEINDFEYNLISFGEKNDLYILSNPENKSTFWLKLTPKGEKFKSFNKGYIKFEKESTKVSLTLYQKIYLPLLIFSILVSSFLGIFNYRLNKSNNHLDNSNIKMKDSINKLNKIIKLKTIKSSSVKVHTNNLKS